MPTSCWDRIPSVRAALDLLLGTQGWRRFAEQDPVHFRQKNGADAERLLATTGQAAKATIDLQQHEVRCLQKHYSASLADLQERCRSRLLGLSLLGLTRPFRRSWPVSINARRNHGKNTIAPPALLQRTLSGSQSFAPFSFRCSRAC